MFFKGSERKEAFLDHKNMGSKNNPKFHFYKGVSPWSKNGDGQSLVFMHYEEKGFFQGSERKEAFLNQITSAQKTTNFAFF